MCFSVCEHFFVLTELFKDLDTSYFPIANFIKLELYLTRFLIVSWSTIKNDLKIGRNIGKIVDTSS